MIFRFIERYIKYSYIVLCELEHGGDVVNSFGSRRQPIVFLRDQKTKQNQKKRESKLAH